MGGPQDPFTVIWQVITSPGDGYTESQSALGEDIRSVQQATQALVRLDTAKKQQFTWDPGHARV